MKTPALLVLAALLAAPHAAPAAPAGFELDLKELKKPSPALIAPPKAKAKAASAPQKKSKAPRRAAPLTKKATAPPPKPAGRVVRLDGAGGCQVARMLMAAVAAPAKTNHILHGLTLQVAATGSYRGATAVLVCGLPTDEAYTFGRLLEADGVRLINLAADQPTELAIDAVAEALGLSYRLLQDNPLSYQTSDHQGRPVRLVIDASTTNR